MQINNSPTLSTQAPSALTRQTPVNGVEAREQVRRSSDSRSQTSDQASRVQQRLDIDEQAIALVEHEQSRTLNARHANADSFQSDYDAPSPRNQSAVAAYQSVDTLAQRENVQQVFGVDLFA